MTAPTDFVYRATVIQYAPTEGPDYLWANTWEFTSPAGLIGDTTAAEAVANAFRNYHRWVLLPRYGVDRVVLSTYGPDLPFPPGFTVYPYRQAGLYGASGNPLPLEVVAFVRKRVARGRSGKLFLRGSLTTEMIQGEEIVRGGLTDFAQRQEQAAQGLLSQLAAVDARIVLARGPIGAIQTRDVISLEAVNARTLQYRARRKTRFQAQALDQLRNAYTSGGGITIDEIPIVIDSLRRLLGGDAFPPLPPPNA